MHIMLWFKIIIIFITNLIFTKLSSQQSAELEDLQRLCPSLNGVFCAHCEHKSVEEICPVECKFCTYLQQGTTDGNTQSRFGIFPQNLAGLRSQCAKLKGIYCFSCKVSAINELCVEECLDCEAEERGDENVAEEDLSGERLIPPGADEPILGEQGSSDEGTFLEVLESNGEEEGVEEGPSPILASDRVPDGGGEEPEQVPEGEDAAGGTEQLPSGQIVQILPDGSVQPLTAADIGS